MAEGDALTPFQEFKRAALLLLVAGLGLGLLFVLAVPNFNAPPRRFANATSAISTLRNLSAAQALFSASSAVDVDGDGVGEYGTFQEMSAAMTPRGAPEDAGPIDPALLSGAFRTITQGGAVARSGYLYRVYLPGPGGVGVHEVSGRAVTAGESIDSELAESIWCAYAWPARHGVSGERTFFVNQDGDILSSDVAQYSGANGPRPGAAFDSGGLDGILGSPAVGTVGQDGNRWKQVN